MTSKVGAVLLRRPRPYQDELLISYIIRLAEENFYDCYWILELAGLQRKSTIYAVNILDPEDDLSLLSNITKTPKAILESMAFLNVQGDKDYVQVSSTIRVPSASIQFAKPRVCTQCLLEAQYVRKVWTFIPVTVCPIHSCLLVNKCPDCDRFLSWNMRFVSPGKNMITTCKSCGFDLRQALPHYIVSTEETALSKYIHQQLSSLSIGINYRLTEYSNPILNLEIEHLCLIVTFFATQFTLPEYFNMKILHNLKNDDLHDLIVKVLLFFEDLSFNYYFLLKWLKNNSEVRFSKYTGSKKESSLYRDFRRRINQVFQPEIYPFLIFNLHEYLSHAETSLIYKSENLSGRKSSFLRRYVDSRGLLI